MVICPEEPGRHFASLSFAQPCWVSRQLSSPSAALRASLVVIYCLKNFETKKLKLIFKERIDKMSRNINRLSNKGVSHE